jgi:hypothetical protein
MLQDEQFVSPPFSIRLAAWATGAAEQLHRMLGDEVELTVGAMRYPQRILTGPTYSASSVPMRRIEPTEARIALDGSLTVTSGFAVKHHLLIHNLGSVEFQVEAPGIIIAQVIDPHTEDVVGGHSGPVLALLMTFAIAPNATARIPLLVATDSFVPDLGYAVPPGEWGIQTTLDPAAGNAGRTPILPFTIADGPAFSCPSG